MVTISHTGFTSNIPLEAILRVKTKEKIVGIITKLGAYISPNRKKNETARRAAAILLDDPQLVLDDLVFYVAASCNMEISPARGLIPIVIGLSLRI